MCKGNIFSKMCNFYGVMQVWCGHSLNDTYTMIQQRIDGKETFYRPYTDYQKGFGHPKGDSWAGLDYISALTQSGINILYS